MKIKRNLFCSLARHQDMHEWLATNAADLLAFLEEKLNNGAGCKDASSYMMNIYRTIINRGDGQKFHEFVSHRFPFVMDDKPTRSEEPQEDPNTHHVFKRYRPRLMQFPQHYIIVDDSRAELEKRVMSFIRGKIGVDYLVIEDRAYIEYFLPHQMELVAKVPKEKREIYAYKRRHQK